MQFLIVGFLLSWSVD